MEALKVMKRWQCGPWDFQEYLGAEEAGHAGLDAHSAELAPFVCKQLSTIYSHMDQQWLEQSTAVAAV
jgi:hypothetical protein